ncbi:MAG TPA: papain-like cysteine protease family protein [Kofleriaceae bacterium]|nr:papain-like cysteine protease family protein [Kofleriaceae bacterium]
MLDPGHGGLGGGGSSGAGVLGACGFAEKVVALHVAQRAAAKLRGAGRPCVLTREDDRAVSLAERAELARRHGASALVSIHVDGGAGTSTWVHERAGAASERLAGALASALGAGGRPARAPLAVLDPRRLPDETAAAHVELADDPRLGEAAHVDGLADAIVRAIDQAVPADASRVVHHEERNHVDIWHEVPLVPQVTGMSCWAAGAAMIIGWRDSIAVDPGEVARAAGRWQEYRDGLEPEAVESFARTWGLTVRCLGHLTVPVLRELLIEHGPLWVGEASPGLHVVVVAGMVGDGTDDGTQLRIVDPWPVGRGERYRLGVRHLAASHVAASRVAGAQALVLHAAGRGRGARRIEQSSSTSEAASYRWSAR